METLHYDPKTKWEIKEKLYMYLYEPVEKKLKAQLNNIILRNTIAVGSPDKSFMYKGEIYSIESQRTSRKINRLVANLIPEMDEYLSTLKELNEKEIPFVMGFINQVLNSSNDLNDYLRIFPPSVHAPIKKMIDSCPYRTIHLSESTVEAIQAKNETSIKLMKQRMAKNLLI